MKEEFESLTPKEQWPWVLKQDKSKILIELDNDVTYIYFKEEQESSTFDNYLGWDAGVIDLLEALGFEARGV